MFSRAGLFPQNCACYTMSAHGSRVDLFSSNRTGGSCR